MKLLIVDDEPLVRIAFQRAFERAKQEVKTVNDGKAALKEWNQFAPDVVLLDVMMPEMTGPEVLKHYIEGKLLRVKKVYLMTAYSVDYDLNRAKSLGADDLLIKPFADIFAIVEQIIKANS